MFQELCFPPGARRRMKRELNKLCPDYQCFLEAGKDSGISDREHSGRASRHGGGNHSRKHYAVATFIHKGVFTSAKRKEWFPAKEKRNLRHMTQGRILWLEATTRQNKLVRIINIHQATSRSIDLQQKLWLLLQSKLSQSPNHQTLMGGDFNANSNGERVGYATSNAAHLARVDEAFAAFVRNTRGQLLSPSTPSRKDARSGKEAKLDHLIVWNLKVEAEDSTGLASWDGDRLHDHAHIEYTVDRTVLANLGTPAPQLSAPRRMNAATWKQISPEIEVEQEERVKERITAVREGRMAPRAAKDLTLQERQATAKKLTGTTQRPKGSTGRAPNRSPAQRDPNQSSQYSPTTLFGRCRPDQQDTTF